LSREAMIDLAIFIEVDQANSGERFIDTSAASNSAMRVSKREITSFWGNAP
jgi:hypothetical protein